MSAKDRADRLAARDPRWSDAAALRCLYPELDGTVIRQLLRNAGQVRLVTGQTLASLLGR